MQCIVADPECAQCRVGHRPVLHPATIVRCTRLEGREFDAVGRGRHAPSKLVQICGRRAGSIPATASAARTAAAAPAPLLPPETSGGRAATVEGGGQVPGRGPWFAARRGTFVAFVSSFSGSCRLLAADHLVIGEAARATVPRQGGHAGAGTGLGALAQPHGHSCGEKMSEYLYNGRIVRAARLLSGLG